MPAMRSIFRFALAALFFLLASALAHAQVTNVTGDQAPPIAGAGHNYIEMLNETVNPGNGSVSINISVPVPPSRGFTVPFSFSYNSNSALHMGQKWTDNLAYLGQGGWSYQIPQANYFGSALVGSAGSPPPVCLYWLDYTFTGLSGDTHALGISSLQPNGVLNCAGQTFNPATNRQVVNQLLGGDARIQASTSVPTQSDQVAPPFKVADMDGLTYSFAPGPNEVLSVPAGSLTGGPQSSNGNVSSNISVGIEDRNGNGAGITDLGKGAFTITDTAGRTAVSSSGFGSTGNTVTVSGLSKPYVVTWETPLPTTLNYSFANICYPAGSGECPSNGSGSLPYNSRNVISNILMPNGQSYQFQYDLGTSLIQKLIYPTAVTSDTLGGRSVFYRPSGAGATNFGHLFIGAFNQKTGQVGFLDYYPKSGTDSLGRGPGTFNDGNMQDRAGQADQFATLTIRTSPEEAQKVLNLIDKLKSGSAQDYAALSNNCTTVCEDVLHDLGLDFGDITPDQYWGDLYRHFSQDVQDNPFKAFPFVQAPHQAGKDYGNPRDYGVNFTWLLFQLYLNQNKPQPKATVCTDDHLGNKSCSSQ